MARAAVFDRIGADKLRAVIEDFYARIFDDVMIGFLFAGKDRRRLIDKEYELTVDAEVVAAWIDHTLALRAQITPDKGSECKDSEAAERVGAAGPEPAADPDKLVGLGMRRRPGS
jgi:hypothetical protein